MKFFVLLLFVFTLSSCSLPPESTRTPASSTLSLAEYDALFEQNQAFAVNEMGGRVFDCISTARNHELTSAAPSFEKIGIMPLGGPKAMITLGDGTDGGTLDSMGTILEGEISLSYRGGHLLIHSLPSLNQLLINSYVDNSGEKLLVYSYHCTLHSK